ncbi:MAG: 5'-methylthioadenosine/adenosylhomocysteine nucleosidase [Clostridia bacterium]|nr:5'-methylthioadenosine/adenosylhomocysteine nucleosidase [Clostridia bacterium]
MIGIIGAMNTEVETLISALDDKKETVIAGSRFFSGKLENTDAVVVMCGIGKVAAAICAQAMIDAFHPDLLINTGVAGGVADGLAQGDIVIATDAVQHDFDLSLFGYAKGYMPVWGKDKGSPSPFPADEALAQKLIAAADLLGYHAIRGRVASGDIFVADADLKYTLATEFGAAVAEMEGAAIAQTAWQNGIPCAIVRAISDLADGSATLSFEEFEVIAAERSAKLLLEICK